LPFFKIREGTQAKVIFYQKKTDIALFSALDPTARDACPQANLLPYVVLAGQRRDYLI
jgi:hypothetical protein